MTEFVGTARFEVRRRIGGGSMGAVYLVRDLQLDSFVALKTLLRVDATGIYRFKNEFRALADLNHPNLVTLHELVCADDQWFFTMEYVEGDDFLAYVHGSRRARYSVAPGISEPLTAARDPFDSPVEGLELLFPSPLADEAKLRDALVQVVSAIRTVHAAGKLHRDIKPENILVTAAGRAVVLDFGIAVERKPDVHRTIATIMGTPAYMAPEQAFGEVSEASDWYALGVVLYEALTGHVPFDGEPTRVLQMKQELDPTAPRDMVADVPDDLNDLCMALLAHDPTERPDGEAVLTRLEAQPTVANAPRCRRTAPKRCFVGRSALLGELESALRATEEDKPVVTLVSGPAGIGKTTLVKNFVGRVADNDRAVVLTGRCYERESVPFKAFDNIIDTLSRYLRALPPIEVVSMLPRDTEALAGLFPVLQRVDALRRRRRLRGPPSGPRELRARAFAALSEMLCRIADIKPLLLLIDDLHWSDEDSVRLLTHLLAGDQRPAMLLICAYRPDAGGPNTAAAQWLSQLEESADIDVRRLPVDSLDESTSYALASELLGSGREPGARRIGFESRGNPQMLSELASYVEDRLRTGKASARTGEGLVSFDQVIAQRIGKLSAAAHPLLKLLSVAGRPVPEPVLALVGSFDIALNTALAELRSEKLIRGVAVHEMRAVEVYHNTIAEAVLKPLEPTELASLHRRLAAALEASGEVDLEAVTDHRLGAGELTRAGVYASRAADQAAEGLAFEKASRLYRLAADHCDDENEQLILLERHADALAHSGSSREAASAFLEAAKRARGTHAHTLHTRTGIQWLLSGELKDAMRVLEGPLERMDVTLLRDQAACIEAATKGWSELAQHGFAYEARDPAAISQKELADLAALDSIIHGLALYNLDQAAHLSVRYANEALKVGDPMAVVRALCLFDIFCDHVVCRIQGAPSSDAVDVAERIARGLNEPEAMAMVTLARGLRAYADGRLAEAMPCLRRAEELFRTQCRGRVHEMRLSRQALCHLSSLMGGNPTKPKFGEWRSEAEHGGDAVTATRLRFLACGGGLFGDRPQETLAELDSTAQSTVHMDSQINDGCHRIMRAAHHLYMRDTLACQTAMYQFDAFLSTLVGMRPLLRAEALLMRARLALALAASEDGPLSLGLHIINDLATVAELDLPCFDDELMLLRAAALLVDGKHVDAATVCLEPLAARDLNDGPLPALALRALGRFSDDRRQLQRAETSLKRAGIANPGAYAWFRAPGLG